MDCEDFRFRETATTHVLVSLLLEARSRVGEAGPIEGSPATSSASSTSRSTIRVSLWLLSIHPPTRIHQSSFCKQGHSNGMDILPNVSPQTPIRIFLGTLSPWPKLRNQIMFKGLNPNTIQESKAVKLPMKSAQNKTFSRANPSRQKMSMVGSLRYERFQNQSRGIDSK